LSEAVFLDSDGYGGDGSVRALGLIGVVIGNTQNPFFLSVQEELSICLSPAGKHGLAFTAEQGSDAGFQIEEVLRYRVDVLLSRLDRPDAIWMLWVSMTLPTPPCPLSTSPLFRSPST
jgi:hypothetical protein